MEEKNEEDPIFHKFYCNEDYEMLAKQTYDVLIFLVSGRFECNNFIHLRIFAERAFERVIAREASGASFA